MLTGYDHFGCSRAGRNTRRKAYRIGNPVGIESERVIAHAYRVVLDGYYRRAESAAGKVLPERERQVDGASVLNGYHGGQCRVDDVLVAVGQELPQYLLAASAAQGYRRPLQAVCRPIHRVEVPLHVIVGIGAAAGDVVEGVSLVRRERNDVPVVDRDALQGL